MRNSRPMPSPKGSNHARQFLPAGFPMRVPVAAYDAAEGLASETVDKILDFLHDKLSSEDLQSVQEILGASDMSMDSDDDGDLKPRGNGNLDPRGNNDIGPRGTSGKERFAQDARLRERALQTSKAHEANFMRRYPGARRIERL